MRAAIRLLLPLVLFVVIPLYGQDSVEHPVILSVGGDDFGATSVNGLAVGFALYGPYCHVTISARLNNGGGFAGYASSIAYLMRAIGPDATHRDQVARVAFDLPPQFDGRFDLFTDIELPAGDYWLVLVNPPGRFSYTNWSVSAPLALFKSNGARYIGTTSTSPRTLAEYPPSSVFGATYSGFGYQFAVTGEPGVAHPDDPPRPRHSHAETDAGRADVRSGSGLQFSAEERVASQRASNYD